MTLAAATDTIRIELFYLVIIGAALTGVAALLPAVARARRIAKPLLNRSCPRCGRVFDGQSMRSTHKERGPGAREGCVNITCPGCHTFISYGNGQLTALPAFELFLGDCKLGLLFEPRREEMFWCSYVVEATSAEAEKILRDEAMWTETKFEVKSRDGRRLPTYSGGNREAYCRRETNRIEFRSLWPGDA